MTDRTGPTTRTRAGRTLAALVLALLALPGLGGVALADGEPPTPAPYGGLLDSPDPGDQVGGDHMLEVALLTVGTVNGLAFAGALIASRLRGSSHAATRRALSARTGRGRVSEAPRRRPYGRGPGAPSAPSAPPLAVPADRAPARGSGVGAGRNSTPRR